MKYIIITIALILSALLYIKLALKLKIVDRPNYRSSHTKPTIRGGGILFLFGLLFFWIMNGFQYSYFIFGTVFIGVLSFIDDVKTLSAKIRWPFQLIAVILMFYQVGLEHFPLWSYLPLLVLAVGFINLFNFLDGINGITGFSSLVTLAGFYYINQDYQVVDNSILIILALSVIIFGFFNFRKKAVMFAGDVGSITMGMVIFYLGIEFIIATQSPLIICLYMVFGADSTLTLLYRVLKREKLSEAHRNHIYQKLVDHFKISHLRVSLYYTALQLLVSSVSIYLMYNIDIKYHFVIGLVISFVLTAIYIYIFRKDAQKA